MNNSEIRSRAWNTYKANLVPLLTVTAAVTVWSALDDKFENIILKLLLAFVGSVLNAGFIYFMVRSWVESKAQLTHITIPFTQHVYRSKILPMILLETVVVLLAAVPPLRLILINSNNPFFFIDGGGIIFLLLVIAIFIVGIAFSLIWYIYIVYPRLKITEIFRKSAVYMGRHWGDYLWFSITITLIPTLITELLTGKIDRMLVSILLIPAQAYIALARAGFVYERILMVEQAKENTIVISAETFGESAAPTAEEFPPETDTETQEPPEENI